MIHPNQTQFPEEVKSLAAVILRRNVSTSAVDTSDVKDDANNANLWKRLDDESRQLIRRSILETLEGVSAVTTPKAFIHKVCNLAVEIQGAIHEEENEEIWQDLLNLLFQFIQGEDKVKIDAALQVFNGLFGYIMDHLVKYKDQLGQIFERCLGFSDLDIKLAALQAIANYLSTAERKDTKDFIKLLPMMVRVVV